MTNSSRPAETRRLYQQVADRIRAALENGGFSVGTRLPPERELALQLGVSRPSLREALIALELDGRVEIRMGSGVYVCAPTKQLERGTPALGESPSELMQARVALESAVAALAAARITAPALKRVRACIESMRKDLLAGLVPLEGDRRFHVTIAEITGNSVLQRMVGELFDGRHDPLSARLSNRSESMHTWSAALEEHEAVLRALEARDPLAAAAAMGAHLQASKERWSGETAGRRAPVLQTSET